MNNIISTCLTQKRPRGAHMLDATKIAFTFITFQVFGIDFLGDDVFIHVIKLKGFILLVICFYEESRSFWPSSV